MSFLQSAGTASLHRSSNHSTAATPPQRGLRKARSHAGILSPLVDLARNPTRPLEVVWNAFLGTETVREEQEERDDGRRQILYLRMKEAETLEAWRSAAQELDVLEGNEAWKQETESAEYDVALVRARLEQLDEARLSCDVKKMLFLIRTSLTRGLGGMGDLRLYKHSHIGTKRLIERYIESAQKTFETLLDLSEKQWNIEPRHVLHQLLEARQAFGRSALLLSGGGAFGMNHIGVVKSLWEVKLLPRIISGSSAGSIVCSVLCTKTDDEIPQVLAEFCYGDLGVFGKEDDEGGLLRKAARFLKHGSVFDITPLIGVMRNLLGDLTFQEAYNRTRRILNISVSSESVHELPRLLNYITAPNVIIWSAVGASCSVPLVFSPAQLLAKDPRTNEVVPWNPSPQRWIDGSVDNDLPMTRLAEMFNVNHFIVSQVNPHVVPFLSKEDEMIGEVATHSTSAVAAGPGWLHTIADLARGETLHRMQMLVELGIFPNSFTKAQSVLSQKYSGDITILPEISYAHFPRILRNPTVEFMEQAMLSGEKATWPKLSRIQNHCAIELALDQAIRKLRSHVVFSPSQVDLRLNSIGVGSGGLKKSSSDRRRANRRVKIGHRQTHSLVEPDHAPQKRPRSLLESENYKHSPGHIHSRYPTPFHSPILKFTPADPLSSSADDEPLDGHLFTDATNETEDTYSSEDDAIVPKVDLWPSTKQLFPSVSTPTTPFFSSRVRNSASSLAMTPKIVVPTTAASGHVTQGPSSPEIRYKRMFHGASASNSRPSTAGTTVLANDVGESQNRGRRSNGAHVSIAPAMGQVSMKEARHGTPQKSSLKTDVSGTRGMLLRMRRSMSTGAKGLMPPGRQ